MIPPIAGGAIFGTFFHAPTPDRLAVFEETLIVVDGNGCITAVLPADDPEQGATMAALGDRVHRLPAGQYGLPGLVDLHVPATASMRWPSTPGCARAASASLTQRNHRPSGKS